MKNIFIITLMVFTSCSHYYYIVRHAEKEPAASNMMSTDVSLSEKGKERAEALKEIMKDKKIGYVFSTNFIRTKSTVMPTATLFHLQIQNYGPSPDSSFIRKLKTLKRNTLIVGHSNTVDNIVNMLCGKKVMEGDLPESEYNKLLIVKKKGKDYIFKEENIYR